MSAFQNEFWKIGKQPFLHLPWLEIWIILLPSFLSVMVAWIFHSTFDSTPHLPLWAWVGFILCIDVAHVYATLFRTYLNPIEWKENQVLLLVVPLLVWISGVLMYSLDSMLFWRVLAYIAVFHFIRQQYGFMMLYSRTETPKAQSLKWIDKTLVYFSTLYPVIYWHTHLPRNFNWFVEGDFILGVPRIFEFLSSWIYGCLLVLYCFKEIFLFSTGHGISIPKQLIIFGTALSWYVGIVAFNGDMVFTMTNVVSHGIPYLGLIWIVGLKQKHHAPDLKILGSLRFRHVFSWSFLPLFMVLLLGFAYAEEGLWAGLVWREHFEVFQVFSILPKIIDPDTLAWLIPLLTLPQFTHYIVDGFIWKLRNRDAQWQKVIFQRTVNLS